jgi:hypothetical protein
VFAELRNPFGGESSCPHANILASHVKNIIKNKPSSCYRGCGYDYYVQLGPTPHQLFVKKKNIWFAVGNRDWGESGCPCPMRIRVLHSKSHTPTPSKKTTKYSNPAALLVSCATNLSSSSQILWQNLGSYRAFCSACGPSTVHIYAC